MKIDADVLKVLNESNKYTFADWFGQDLTGQIYEGDIDCSGKGITSLEGAPQEVSGRFDCEDNQLTSLEGAPQKVGGAFRCHDNKLISLEGAPQEVGGSFWCNYNQLTSLIGAPQKVDGEFNCSDNPLTSLEGAPQKVEGDFTCRYNQLTSLEGSPQEVGGGFYCEDNQLTSLMGAPQKVGGSFCCSDNPLTSLEGAPQEVSKSFYCYDCKSLISLEGAPQNVGGGFYCGENKLTSLEGAPQKVGGTFDCSSCKSLTFLEGAPQEVGGDFDCSHCYSLTSLEGAPQEVGGNFNCTYCKSLTSLEGAPQEVNGDFYCDASLKDQVKVTYTDTTINTDDYSNISNTLTKLDIKPSIDSLINEFDKGIAKFEKEFLTPIGFCIQFDQGFEPDSDGIVNAYDYPMSIYGDIDSTNNLATALFLSPDCVEGLYFNGDGHESDAPYGDEIQFDKSGEYATFDGKKIPKSEIAKYVYESLVKMFPEFKTWNGLYIEAKNYVNKCIDALDEIEDIENVSEYSNKYDKIFNKLKKDLYALMPEDNQYHFNPYASGHTSKNKSIDGWIAKFQKNPDYMH